MRRRRTCQADQIPGINCYAVATMKLVPLTVKGERLLLCSAHAEIFLHAANHVARVAKNMPPIIASYRDDFHAAVYHFEHKTR